MNKHLLKHTVIFSTHSPKRIFLIEWFYRFYRIGLSSMRVDVKKKKKKLGLT